MHMNITHRNINFSAIGILAYAVFFAAGNTCAGLLDDPPMWESGPADSPVDTRIYIVDNYRKTIAVNGWEKAPPVKVMDVPMRVQAAITPAKIVYTDPDSGEILGVSEYIGNTIFGFNRYREYQTDNDGYIDLVSRNASIMRVKALEDGYAANDPRHGKMYWYCQEIREERTAGVGIHMGTPARGLWVDCTPDSNDSPFPGTKGKSKGKGETGASSGSPAKQLPPTSGAATSGSSQIPGTPQSAWSGDETRQPRQPMTSAQKQLMLSDMLNVKSEEKKDADLTVGRSAATTPVRQNPRRRQSSTRHRNQRRRCHGAGAGHASYPADQHDPVPAHHAPPAAHGADVAALKMQNSF